ncbi:hypothetical protein [Micromonospora chersina]|uniref:hypothetical protein n=1 Tax=Micromonospora chersina TaxID=47854 RepID=UPI003409473C
MALLWGVVLNAVGVILMRRRALRVAAPGSGRQGDLDAVPGLGHRGGARGISYYWHTYPAIVAECRSRLRAILADAAAR